MYGGVEISEGYFGIGKDRKFIYRMPIDVGSGIFDSGNEASEVSVGSSRIWKGMYIVDSLFGIAC